MRHFAAALLAAVIAVSALCGCADRSANNVSKATSAESDKEEAKTPVVEETDFMACFLGGGETNYLGLTLDEFNSLTGNIYNEENAVEYDLDFGQLTYSLGDLDSIFCGRAKFDKAYPVTCIISIKDNKVKEIFYHIGDDDSQGDPGAVCKVIADCLAENLPEDYNGEYDYPVGGADSARFANSVDGYVFSVCHSNVGGSDYPVTFSLESYKDKYGMK